MLKKKTILSLSPWSTGAVQGYAAAYGSLDLTAVVNILYYNFLHILLGDEVLNTQPEGRGKGLFVISFVLARQNHV